MLALPVSTAVFGLLNAVVIIVIFNQDKRLILNYYYYVACRRLGIAPSQREWSSLEALSCCWERASGVYPCRSTGKGGNVMCQFEFAGEALVGHHHTEPASANRTWGQRRCCRSLCFDRVRSVNWPWTFRSGSSAMASPRSQNESALPASDSPVCVTWTSCTPRGISQGRRAG